MVPLRPIQSELKAEKVKRTISTVILATAKTRRITIIDNGKEKERKEESLSLATARKRKEKKRRITIIGNANSGIFLLCLGNTGVGVTAKESSSFRELHISNKT
jgi:hypothetical protein